MPSGAAATARGPSSGVPRSGAPSGVGSRSPVPPIVSIVPVVEVDGADAVIADVADQQAIADDDHAVRRAELRPRRGTAVTREAGGAGAGQRRQRPRARLDLADDMTVPLGDVEMAAAIEGDLVRHVQGAGRRRAAVAGVAALAAAGDIGRAARPQVEPPDPLVVEVAEVERPVRADDHAVRVVDLARRRGRDSRCRSRSTRDRPPRKRRPRHVATGRAGARRPRRRGGSSSADPASCGGHRRDRAHESRDRAGDRVAATGT